MPQSNIKQRKNKSYMSEVELKKMNHEIAILKKDVAKLKDMVHEERELTPLAQRRLEKARKIPLSKYRKL